MCKLWQNYSSFVLVILNSSSCVIQFGAELKRDQLLRVLQSFGGLTCAVFARPFRNEGIQSALVTPCRPDLCLEGL